jgi:hypothetical protein
MKTRLTALGNGGYLSVIFRLAGAKTLAPRGCAVRSTAISFAAVAGCLFAMPLLSDGPMSRAATATAGGGGPGFALAPEGSDIVCGCVTGTPENEPDCGIAGDPPTDTTNGGCNSAPPVFGTIGCFETVCGTVGTKLSTLDYRDTDWYELELEFPQPVEIEVAGETAMTAFILHDGSGGPPSCPASGSAQASADACGEATTSADLDAGTFWIFAASTNFSGVTCGTSYRLTVLCPDWIFWSDFEQPGALCYWSDTDPPVTCF